MSEELLDKKEHNEYELEICWGRPPEFEGHTRDICSVYVKSKTEDGIVFTEQTHISLRTRLGSENPIKIRFPEAENCEKFLTKNLIAHTIRKAKDRIDSEDYKKGETYPELITTQNLERWLDKIKLMSEE